VDVDELVHDAAADADEFVLGLLGHLDQVRLSRPMPNRALTAKARPPSIAADEDIPAPMGMSPPKTQLTPAMRCPALTN